MIHRETTGQVLKGFYEVYNHLGYGFLERVYENSLALVLRRYRLNVIQQKPIHVHFDGTIVGQYFADLVVEDCVIVEIKSAKELAREHEAQLLNYLKATPYEVGLLLNFGPVAGFERRVFENSRKGSLAWLERADADKRGPTRSDPHSSACDEV